MNHLTVVCIKKVITLRSGPYPGDVRDNFKCDSTARDGAALRHSPQQTLGKTLPPKPTAITNKSQKKTCHHMSNPSSLWATHLSASDVDAEALPEDELHAGWVAQLDHGTDCQVDPLVGGGHATQEGAVVDCRVPGGLHLHLDHVKKG